MRDVEEMTTCQISFLPIESKNYKDDIKRVLSLIEESGLDLRTGDVSTTVKGSRELIWVLIRNIYETMDPGCRFVIDLKISIICGCR